MNNLERRMITAGHKPESLDADNGDTAFSCRRCHAVFVWGPTGDDWVSACVGPEEGAA